MALTERLAYLVTADSTNAVEAFGKIGSAAKRNVAAADKDIASLQKRIDALGRTEVRAGRKGDAAGASAAATEAKNLSGELTKLQAPAGRAGALMERFGLSSSQSAVEAAAAGVAIAGVGAGVLAAGKSVGVFKDLTAEVRAFQRASGASPQEASGLLYAFKQVGIDGETAGTALFRLSKNVDGSQQKLAKLGVEVARNHDGSVDLVETLKNVGDAYRGTTNQVERNQIAQAAFGRGGLELAPILGKTRQELADLQAQAKESGLVFSQDDLDKGKQMTVAMRQLHAELQGLEVSAGRTLTPLATDAAKGAKHGLDLLHVIGQIIDAPRKAGASIGDTLGIPKAGDDAKKLTAVVDDTAAAYRRQRDAAKQAREDDAASTKDAEGAAEGLSRAKREVADAEKAVADAADAEARKSKAVADAHAAEQRAAEDVATAEKALADARRDAPRDLQRAQIAAREADRAVTDARKAAERTHRRRRPGSEDDQRAADDLTSSLLAQADAHDRLNELTAGGAHPKSVTDAERARDDAKARQADAAQRTADANKTDVLAEQQAAADRLKQARIDEQNATTTLVDKLKDVNTQLQAGFDITKATKDEVDLLVARLAAAATAQAALLAGTYPPVGPGGSAPADVIGPKGGVGPTARGPVGTVIGQAAPTTTIHQYGPNTIVANDPADMEKKLAARARLQRVGGYRGLPQ